MTGFDPSKFLDRETKAKAKPAPPPSPPVAENATRTLLQSAAQETTQDQPVWRRPAKYVAGVATVAALDVALPYAKPLNAMFEGPIPPIYTPRPWRTLCEGIRKFVEKGHCEKALASGWQPIEIFGCYARPWEVYSWPLATLSLALILHGRSVGHVDGSRIEILNYSGGRRDPSSNLYRAHHMTRRQSCVLMWEALDLRNWPETETEVIYSSS